MAPTSGAKFLFVDQYNTKHNRCHFVGKILNQHKIHMNILLAIHFEKNIIYDFNNWDRGIGSMAIFILHRLWLLFRHSIAVQLLHSDASAVASIVVASLASSTASRQYQRRSNPQCR